MILFHMILIFNINIDAGHDEINDNLLVDNSWAIILNNYILVEKRPFIVDLPIQNG